MPGSIDYIEERRIATVASHLAFSSRPRTTFVRRSGSQMEQPSGTMGPVRTEASQHWSEKGGRTESDICTAEITPKRTYNVRLTARQRRYIRGRLQGKSKVDAALDAGYTLQTARNA